jgi:hypothetical protein
MKALLIADTDFPVRKITEYVVPYGFDVIRYRSAVKAIDNIEEIRPDAVFISAGDFPRHWKTIVQFIRADTGKDTTVIILLTNERFSADDADKAVHIGVQAIVGETFASGEDEKQLFELLSRYRHIGGEEAADGGISGVTGEKAVFLFTNPSSDTIITGSVEKLGTAQIRFKPDAPSMTADLAVGDLLDQCSLKLGTAILSPRCRVSKNAYLLVLDLIDPAESLTKAISAFISSGV